MSDANESQDDPSRTADSGVVPTEHIAKWRDAFVDPFKINFKHLVIHDIYNYPYAGNDVMECRGTFKGEPLEFFLKIEGNKMAAFDAEVETLQRLDELLSGAGTRNVTELKIPRVLEFGVQDGVKFIAITKMEGHRLSVILNNLPHRSIDYMRSYGRKLAEIHSLPVRTVIAKQRAINDCPLVEELELTEWERSVVALLAEKKPAITFDTFIHGDFHYANVLWKDREISGILDWEYSGRGFREQDIAWAVVLRPSQLFLDTREEVDAFLAGYREVGSYNAEKLRWCLLNGYTHFYLIGRSSEEGDANKAEYCSKMTRFIDELMRRSWI